MFRFLLVIVLLLLTAPIPGLVPNEIAGLPGWVVQVVAGALLFAVLVSLLLQKYWTDR